MENISYSFRPGDLLQQLIRFDTTNPPGNEEACVLFIKQLLEDAGIETALYAKTPERPNLVAILKGRGNAPPLLLQGHVDVVTTEKQAWQKPPFEGAIEDGLIWGRGVLDMKGGVAMMVAAFLRAKEQNLDLPGDVILLVLADEEAGGIFGAKYMVEEHDELFTDVRYAIGEFGGFTLNVAGAKLYPIMVAEKQICWIKATFRGLPGHGSMPVYGEAMGKLAHALQTLDRKRLPIHVTPPAQLMFSKMAEAVGGVGGTLLRQLTNPRVAGGVVALLGEQTRIFEPLLRNTVSPTILRGSDKINVIPAEAVVELDGRMLPGFKPEEMVEELRRILGNEVLLEVVQHDPGPEKMDMGLFDMFAGILKEKDPAGSPVPLLLSGVTDGRFFSRLGIQTYGFIPMQLPAEINFPQTIHGADERAPVDAFTFGTDAIYLALQRFGG